jgi:predicted dithiol-disulfide oxidoreductase (DUF899 family)
MNYRETSAQLGEYRHRIAELRRQMREVRAAAEPEEVPDYVFRNSAGSVRLSELFGEKPDLIVIHNMGTSCPNCTLWADGSTASMTISRTVRSSSSRARIHPLSRNALPSAAAGGSR